MQQAQFPDRKEPANASPSFEHVQELKKKRSQYDPQPRLSTGTDSRDCKLVLQGLFKKYMYFIYLLKIFLKFYRYIYGWLSKSQQLCYSLSSGSITLFRKT